MFKLITNYGKYVFGGIIFLYIGFSPIITNILRNNSEKLDANEYLHNK